MAQYLCWTFTCDHSGCRNHEITCTKDQAVALLEMTRAGWMPGPTTAGIQRFFCPEHTARANMPERRGAIS
ncbi:hypothetical protein [Janibacter anophelis]|uniref:hypothetical protein n=1 Tax=Janibacter anophelis TaxID=319054 RepID=UPI000DEEA99C|nr:hypothetical protein [Janibacter anophelis]